MNIDPAERARLEALAYGRTGSADDKRAAANARQRLQQLEDAEREDAAATASASSSGHHPEHGDDESSEASGGAPRSRRRQLVTAVGALTVALFLVGAGYLGGLAAGSNSHESEDIDVPGMAAPLEAGSGYLGPTLIPGGGDLDAAERFLSRAPAEHDDFLSSTMAETLRLDPASVRQLGISNDVVYAAARGIAGELCLLAVGGVVDGASSCTERHHFESTGLHISGSLGTAQWDGTTLTLATSTR